MANFLSCDLAVCCCLAEAWFVSPEIDFAYSICDKFDIDHARKRLALERSGFKELPGKPSRDEIKAARIMMF